jgi:hypothetical protein
LAAIARSRASLVSKPCLGLCSATTARVSAAEESELILPPF